MRTLYFPRPVTILTPYFRRTPVPSTPEKLWETLSGFDYILVRIPQVGTDRLSAEPDAVTDRLYAHVEKLIRRKKLIPLPDTQDMILRVAVTAAGSAAESRTSSSASRINLDASFLNADGNTRPRK